MPRGKFAYGDDKTPVIFGMTNVNYQGAQPAQGTQKTDGSARQASGDFSYGEDGNTKEEQAQQRINDISALIDQDMPTANGSDYLRYYSYGMEEDDSDDFYQSLYEDLCEMDEKEAFQGRHIYVDFSNSDPMIRLTTRQVLPESIQKFCPSPYRPVAEIPLAEILNNEQLRSDIESTAVSLDDYQLLDESAYFANVSKTIDAAVSDNVTRDYYAQEVSNYGVLSYIKKNPEDEEFVHEHIMDISDHYAKHLYNNVLTKENYRSRFSSLADEEDIFNFDGTISMYRWQSLSEDMAHEDADSDAVIGRYVNQLRRQ